jgi:hypothetical protein
MKKLFDGNKARVESFRRISPTATEEEKRKLEMETMRPERLPHYGGEEPGATASDPIGSRVVKVVLRTDATLDLMRKHFGVRNYVEPNIREIVKFEALLQALEEGIITYDKESNTYCCCA